MAGKYLDGTQGLDTSHPLWLECVVMGLCVKQGPVPAMQMRNQLRHTTKSFFCGIGMGSQLTVPDFNGAFLRSSVKLRGMQHLQLMQLLLPAVIVDKLYCRLFVMAGCSVNNGLSLPLCKWSSDSWLTLGETCWYMTCCLSVSHLISHAFFWSTLLKLLMVITRLDNRDGAMCD